MRRLREKTEVAMRSTSESENASESEEYSRCCRLRLSLCASCFLNALLPAVRSCSTDTNWSLSINSMSPEFRRVKYSSSLVKKMVEDRDKAVK